MSQCEVILGRVNPPCRGFLIGVKTETIQLLTQSELQELDVDARNVHGHSAWDLLTQRDDVSTELSAAYEALLVSLEISIVGKKLVNTAAS